MKFHFPHIQKTPRFFTGILLVLCCLFQPQFSQAQSDAAIDSLKQIIASDVHDSIKLKAYKNWDDGIYTSDPNLDFELNLKMEELSRMALKKEGLNAAESKFFQRSLGGALNVLGGIYQSKGDSANAIRSILEGAEMRKAAGDLRGLAISLRNAGVIYREFANYKKAEEFYKKSLDVFSKVDNKVETAKAYNDLGLVYYDLGEFQKAQDYYQKCLEIERSINNKLGIARVIVNIAIVYRDLGDYSKAVDLNNQSLHIREEIKDSSGLANSYSNLAVLYTDQKDDSAALRYTWQSLELYRRLNDQSGIARTIGNIAIIYQRLGRFEKAIAYQKQTLEIFERLGDRLRQAVALSSMSLIYLQQHQLSLALEYAQKGKEISEEIGNTGGVANALQNIGSIYLEQGNLAKAIEAGEQSLEISTRLETLLDIQQSADLLFKVYQKQGKFREALEMHQLAVSMRDSVANKANQQAIYRQELQYNYNKERLADSLFHLQEGEIKDLEIARQKAESDKSKAESERTGIELDQQRTQGYFLFGGLGIVLLFSIFLFNRFRVTQRQKKVIEDQKLEVENQKELVETKNQEITDSITYAKRIQTAILPPDRIVKQHLKNAFVLYLPKDIVAGDFYWLDVPETDSDTVIFAAADCTGHGVPGAMVSVVCNNALNRAVREFGIIQPAAILDKVRELVIKTFEESDEQVKDGMDIALCAYNFKTRELQYAGANNALWIVKENSTELTEIKADKQPIGIGGYGDTHPFTNHNIALTKGDTIYIFSDGYADQFGGPRGKKLKQKTLKSILVSGSKSTMEEQKGELQREFNKWKGELEQVDDVCIIGFRV
jgi:tetratricopeptide (TPR) repeat protein